MEFQNIVRTVNETAISLLITVDDACKGLRPWQIIVYTLITTLLLVKSWYFLNKPGKTLRQRAANFGFRTIRSLPVIGTLIATEAGKVKSQLSAEKLFKLKKGMTYMTRLPHGGYSDSRILKEIDEYLSLDRKWQDGSVSGGIYYGGSDLTDLVAHVLKKFMWSNPLHADIFPATRKMEAEVARMTCDMFHGDPVESSGCVSSGGTESILLALKAYRDWGNEQGIEYPEIVCPISAHAAFEKGAHYFKMRLVQVPLDARTWKVDMKKMKRAITRNTCLLVGSAPNFPHGMIDPIEEIAALGRKHGIPVHVDACLGGFLIPFMDDAGYPLRPFDFRVEGVTSISADTHKYGYAPKGTSCIMYSSQKWRRYQYFVSADWQGGMYATPTTGGSRTGTVIAACWATMMRFGRAGYVTCTRKIVSTTRYITEQLREIDNIYVFGDPQVSVVAIGSLDFDIFRLSSALVEKGWNLNSLQFPSALHLCCTMLHTQPGVADRFIRDVRGCVQQIMINPGQKNTGATAMYGMAQTIPDRSLVSELTGAYLDAVYDTSSSSSPAGDNVHQNGVKRF